MTKAILINGGNSVESRLTGVENYIAETLLAKGVEVETIHVHQLPAYDLLTANYASEAIATEVAKVEAADIVVFLTPIYKGSYTGILKTFIDVLPQKVLEGKHVFPVAIGGSIAHLLALEYSLKPVLSILGATQVESPVYIVDLQVARTATGFELDATASERVAKVFDGVRGGVVVQL